MNVACNFGGDMSYQVCVLFIFCFFDRNLEPS